MHLHLRRNSSRKRSWSIPGAACGKIVFSAEDAEEWNARGEKVVLVRLETSPEDITGMKASQGILTVRGGMTSHALLLQEVWEHVAYLAVVILQWTKLIKVHTCRQGIP